MPPPINQSGVPEDRITVVCLRCHKPQEVGRKTMTMTCKFCGKHLSLEDVRINKYDARKVIETCGIVTVERGGNVVANLHCGGVVVRGKVKGNIKSRGPVLVGPEAEIRGDVSAPTIAVGPGAVLDGNYEIGTPAAQDVA